MNVVLNQNKLNGTNKKGITVFNWRGQFNSDFVQYILKKFANDTSIICDPFSGSGTVLYECARRNIRCVGMDINPSAYYMSKFFSYANTSKADREILVRNVKKNIEFILIKEKMTFEGFVKDVKQVSSEEEMCFIVNIIFIASKSKKIRFNMNEEIWKAFKYVEKQIMNLPVSNNKIDAYLKDVRELANDGLKNEFTLMFTSPPYINVFNYHQNYREAVELLGWDVLDIAQSEIGSNRKNRGNRFKTIVQYCSDMLLALKGFWDALKEGGIVILVLGKASFVRGIEFYNGAIIKDLIKETKSFKLEECYERSFVNKFGKEIYEDVIICRKTRNRLYDADIGKKVAIKHLKQALKNVETESEIYNSIQKTMEEINVIEASPILNINKDVV